MKGNGASGSGGSGAGIRSHLLRRLAGAGWVRKLLPSRLLQWGHRLMPESYYREVWLAEDEAAAVEEVSSYPASVGVVLGVIKGFASKHAHIAGACRELGVPYRLVDITVRNWIEAIRESGCDMFLVHPVNYLTVWKQMYDERLRVLVQEMGKSLYPTYDELWLYESKRRVSYWLEANGVPQARTWVFYSCDEAMAFARTAPLPIVAKTDLGASASGVRVHRSRSTLLRDVRRAFSRGVTLRGGDLRDRQWGHILLQEYIPDAREWRMMRIGDSYFGYEKVRKGDYHSGSHLWRYSLPPSELLEFLRDVTEKGKFTSMDLDILVSADGKFHVIEIQSVFGMGYPYEMCVVDGERGRMLYDAASRSWRFEPGNFCQNYLWNQRLEYVLEQLRKQGKI